MSTKLKNCSKVKNACKYCLQQVTNKTGIQCQGACKKWAHFDCLNYTPGKISDIKAGIIKVMCPCPDCETTQEKEYLTKPPFSCSNNQCPANTKGPIICESEDCPSNRKNKKSGNNMIKCSNKACPEDAKEFQSQMKSSGQRIGSPPLRSCMSPASRPETQTVKKVPNRNSNSPRSCKNPECKNSSSTTSGEERNPKVHGEESNPQVQAAMVDALQEMCGTVGKLSMQITKLIGKINKLT